MKMMTKEFLLWAKEVIEQEYNGDLVLFNHEVNSV